MLEGNFMLIDEITPIAIYDEKKYCQPYISICIASYNYGKYLRRGFEAIKRQKYRDFELIYLDDNSNDDSIKIIKEFIIKNPEIRISLYQNSKNEGLLNTKSALLKLAKGKYIMLCDADDWMADNCLQVLAKRAAETEADRIISEVIDIDEKGKAIQIQDFPEKPSKWLWNLNHGVLYKRQILLQWDMRILLYPDDVYLSTLFNSRAKSVEWVREPLYYWFVHKESAGRSKKAKNQKNILEEFEKMLVFIDHIYQKERREKFEIGLLMVKLYYLQIFHEMRKYNLIKQLFLYKELQKVMSKHYPKYRNNIFLFKKMKDAPARKYAILVMRLGVILEKMHLMCPALIGYHLLSKWIIFDQ